MFRRGSALVVIILLLLLAVPIAAVGLTKGSGAAATGRSAAEATIFLNLNAGMNQNGDFFIRLGRTLKPTGTIYGTDSGGFTDSPQGRIALSVKQQQGSRWPIVKRASVPLDPAGSFRWSYKPLSKGHYFVRATYAGNATFASDRTPWQDFYVK